MKKLPFTLLFCLLTIVAVVTPILGGPAAARGKLAPVSSYTGSGFGSYVLSITTWPDQPGLFSIKLDMTARKLEAGSYHIGFIEDGDPANVKYDYPITVGTKGSLSGTTENGGKVYEGSHTFKPVLLQDDLIGTPIIIMEGSTATVSAP